MCSLCKISIVRPLHSFQEVITFLQKTWSAFIVYFHYNTDGQIDDLAQDYSISKANALVMLQSALSHQNMPLI